VHPIAFNLGPLPVYWYGVMMAVAFLAGLWTAGRRAPHGGIVGEKIVDLGPWLIVGAIVGARLFYVVSYWREQFAGQPVWEIFMVRHGGLVYYGGLLGASLAGVIYVRLRQLPLWKVADIFAPSIALGNVFGRIGCLMYGCCYGRTCHLPWAIRFPPDHETGGQPVHPTEIYDSLLNLGMYLALAWLFRRKRFDGQVFATWLVGYALTRSFVECFRGDYTAMHLHGGLTPGQLAGIPILAAGLVLFRILSRGKTGVK
jgi:phosphatidylglycerol:prolipoprotein diacylglycerol transferase